MVLFGFAPIPPNFMDESYLRNVVFPIINICAASLSIIATLVHFRTTKRWHIPSVGVAIPNTLVIIGYSLFLAGKIDLAGLSVLIWPILFIYPLTVAIAAFVSAWPKLERFFPWTLPR